MKNQKLMGLDLEVGSSPNSRNPSRYAITLYRGAEEQLVSLRNVSHTKFCQLIHEFQPSFLVSDNIYEIIGKKAKLNAFLASLPENTSLVQVTYDQSGYQRPLTELARKAKLTNQFKLDPLKTSELCIFLLIRGYGMIIKKDQQLILVQDYLKNSSLLSDRQVDHKIDAFELRQFPNLLSNYQPHSTFVSMVGEGKEAIVGLFLDNINQYQIIKCFRKYSPVVNRLKSEVFHYHEWDYAIKLAKTEANYLKLAHHNKIYTPKVYNQLGPFVVMEAIFNEIGGETKLAPSLAQINLRHQGIDPIESFYQTMDIIYDLFKVANLIHNDFSAQNILQSNEKICVIDFSQAELINFNTFMTTPKRIRLDKALPKLKNDIITISNYYSKKYRLSIDTKEIFPIFLSIIPQKLLNQFDENVIAEFLKP